MVAVRGRGLKKGALKAGISVRNVSQQLICFYFRQINAQKPEASFSKDSDPLSLS